jgi:hypothetical protein
MPKVQGLSKAEANYRKAENPKFSCHECRFMFPRLAIGGCPLRARRDPRRRRLRRVQAAGRDGERELRSEHRCEG